MDEFDSLINDTPEITPEVDLSDASDFSEPEMGELEVDVLEESFFQEPTFSEDDLHPRDPLSEEDALEEGSTFVDSNRDDIDQGYNETIETSSDGALNLRDLDIVIGTDLDRTEHRIDFSSDNMTTEEPYSLQALEEEQSRHETKPEIIRPTDEVRPDAVRIELCL